MSEYGEEEMPPILNALIGRLGLGPPESDEAVEEAVRRAQEMANQRTALMRELDKLNEDALFTLIAVTSAVAGWKARLHPVDVLDAVQKTMGGCWMTHLRDQTREALEGDGA